MPGQVWNWGPYVETLTLDASKLTYKIQAPLMSNTQAFIGVNTDSTDNVTLCQSMNDIRIHARHTEMSLNKWHGRAEFLQL